MIFFIIILIMGTSQIKKKKEIISFDCNRITDLIIPMSIQLEKANTLGHLNDKFGKRKICLKNKLINNSEKERKMIKNFKVFKEELDNTSINTAETINKAGKILNSGKKSRRQRRLSQSF